VRFRSRLAGVLAGAAILASVAACEPSAAARESEARVRIDTFLAAVRDGTNGFGWTLLSDDVRAAYPGGGNAWVEAIGSSDRSGLAWTILDVKGEDYRACANVDFGRTREAVPFTLYDDALPGPARVAASLSSGPFHICATTGPFPWDAGIHGVG
jgi:hypothetical protein